MRFQRLSRSPELLSSGTSASVSSDPGVRDPVAMQRVLVGLHWDVLVGLLWSNHSTAACALHHGCIACGRSAKHGRALPPKGLPASEGHGTPSGSSGASASSEAAGGPAGDRGSNVGGPALALPVPTHDAVPNPFSGFEGAPGWFAPRGSSAGSALWGSGVGSTAGGWSRQASAGSVMPEQGRQDSAPRWERMPSWAADPSPSPGQSPGAAAPAAAPADAASSRSWQAGLGPEPGALARRLSAASGASSVPALWGSRLSSTGGLSLSVSPLPSELPEVPGLHAPPEALAFPRAPVKREGGAMGVPSAASDDVASVAATAGGSVIGAAAASRDASQHGASGGGAGASPESPVGSGPRSQAPDSGGAGGGSLAQQAVGEGSAQGLEGRGDLSERLAAAAPLTDVSTSLTAWLPGEAQRPAPPRDARSGCACHVMHFSYMDFRVWAAPGAATRCAQRVCLPHHAPLLCTMCCSAIREVLAHPYYASCTLCIVFQSASRSALAEGALWPACISACALGDCAKNLAFAERRPASGGASALATQLGLERSDLPRRLKAQVTPSPLGR